MKTKVMNMVRLLRKNEVVVLDKIKKYGWEGLTFPGGKMEDFESAFTAAKREIKEETNLDIEELEYNGLIQWYDKDERYLGFLYTSRKFTGELIEENREGKLFFEDYEKFKKRKQKSDSMDYILDIYDGKYDEIVLYYEGSKLIDKKFFKYKKD